MTEEPQYERIDDSQHHQAPRAAALESPSPTAANADEAMTQDAHTFNWERRNAVMVRALTNRIYQQDRRRIMELREGFVKVVSLLGGSAALSQLASLQTIAWIGAAVVFANGCSLVFGYGAKARDAAQRASEWAMLDRDIHAVGPLDYTVQQLANWEARCNEIEASEPAANWLLFQRAYERACESIGATPSKTLSRCQRWRLAILIP